MDLGHILLLFVAGLVAGAVNALAGGGSLITFPSLIAIGMPTVDANVTNSVSVFPGYVSSVVGSRADLAGQGRRLRAIVPASVVGAGAGCALLLLTPARAFDVIVPFLVLAAAATLAFQERLRGLVGHPRALSPRRQMITLQAVVFVGAIYGGYFGAALGVMYVAALALVLDESLNRINALKNVLSASRRAGHGRGLCDLRAGPLGCGARARAGHDRRWVRRREARPPPAGEGPEGPDRLVRYGDRPAPAVPRVLLTTTV